MKAQPATRAVWLRVLTRDLLLSDGTKLVLTVLGQRMNAAGLVKYQREHLAEDLGRSTRAITRHLSSAIEAGYLIRQRRGQQHQVAIYQASLPVRGTLRETPRETEPGDLRETPTSTKTVPLRSVERPDLRETPVVSPHRERERSDHGAVDRSASHVPATTKSGNEQTQEPSTSPLVLAACESWGIQRPRSA